MIPRGSERYTEVAFAWGLVHTPGEETWSPGTRRWGVVMCSGSRVSRVASICETQGAALSPMCY